MSVRFRTLVGASFAGILCLSGAAPADAQVTLEQIFKYKPSQKDVDVETPTAVDLEKCKVEVENSGALSGWVVYGPQGQVLRRFTPQNAQFSLRTSEGVRALEPGSLIMVSPRYKVAVNHFGQLTTTRQAWSGPHTPDINEMLVILSAARLPSPGVIIFSGMGDDGAEGLRIFEATGGRVWAQSPDSAICPAMPLAAE